ncbi:acyl-CoA dehydrogenase [Hoyosella subflava]|uniref:Possible acyl-CoA dehydrogenase n=1 Tax=Hoyosella subflava (strain DSM 45089 / JCM 17490 / NBRC 109087 / DQS3-9A1) TaxID=443218 RepID=F6EN37_HOYSD|nr:acyl-CoA dehydrogenase [Hoyosella subflava]AEF39354.1 Possible acyl-CoA dehydrogenase [Hoyosella subflava DQS3-9A1]
MPIATTDTQRALTEAVRTWAARAHPIDAARTGDYQSGWSALASLGLFGVAVPEELGGAGGTTTDAAAGLEAAATALAPGPVFTTLLAATLLGRAPDAPAAKEAVPELVEGSATAAVAIGSHGVLRAESSGGTELVLRGSLEFVPGATSESYILAPIVTAEGEVWVLIPPGTADVHVTKLQAFDLSTVVGNVDIDGAVLAPAAVIPELATGRVRDVAAMFAAAEAAGVAAWCLATAAEYARTREQFGAKIGSFQAIKLLCATSLCRTEKAAALAWDAARAADQSGEQFTFSAAVAAAGALDAAVDTAKDCIQVLGGIGFTWEHDAHLYLRRAVALRQLLGGSAFWQQRVSELARNGVRRRIDIDLSAVEVDVDDIRSEVAAIAASPGPEQRRRLVEAGYFMPHWPKPFGLGATPAQQIVIDRELDAAGITRPSLVIGGWAAATIMEHGTAAQHERFLWPTLLGEVTWCQLFSEPEAGSDLASLRTRAVRADGGWLLTGSKIWTSLAHDADWAICLARTDPDAAKHKGITFFLVDMESAGIEIRPLREITGEERFNQVFLDNVFVPDECVVGGEGSGWKLARTTLANERVAMSGSATLGESLERLLGLADLSGDAAVGALVVDSVACAVLDLRAVVSQLDGRGPGPESSVRKLIGVAHRQDVAETALEMLGVQGAVADSETARSIQHEFLLTRCLSIAGGTTEILRNVAAERILGLPR